MNMWITNYTYTANYCSTIPTYTVHFVYIIVHNSYYNIHYHNNNIINYYNIVSILLYILCVTWFPYSVIPGNHYCSVSRLIMTIIVFREVKPVTIINYMSTHHAGHAAIKSTKRDWEIHAHLVISSQLGFYPEIEVWGLAASCTQLHARTTYMHVPWVSLKYACVYCYI